MAFNPPGSIRKSEKVARMAGFVCHLGKESDSPIFSPLLFPEGQRKKPRIGRLEKKLFSHVKLTEAFKVLVLSRKWGRKSLKQGLLHVNQKRLFLLERIPLCHQKEEKTKWYFVQKDGFSFKWDH